MTNSSLTQQEVELFDLMLDQGNDPEFIRFLIHRVKPEKFAELLPKFRENPTMGEVEILQDLGVLGKSDKPITEEDSPNAIEVSPGTNVFQYLLRL